MHKAIQSALRPSQARAPDLDKAIADLEAAQDRMLAKGVEWKRRALAAEQIIRDLVKQMEGAVDLDKPSFADARCRECTHGTTPDDWKPRQCAYHQALEMLAKATGEHGQ